MKFRDYYQGLTPNQKIELATKLGTSPAYLSQLAHGHRNAGASILLKIEEATGGAVLPKEMRMEDAA